MTVNKVAVGTRRRRPRGAQAEGGKLRVATAGAIRHSADSRFEGGSRKNAANVTATVCSKLRKRGASLHDKARLGVGGRATILALRCRHEAEGLPFAVEDRLINVQAVPDALKQDFSITPPNTWLVGHVPWTEAEHRITACNADKGVAADLGIEQGAACLVIERRTWRNGEPITAVRITHPGRLYNLIARFTPTG